MKDELKIYTGFDNMTIVEAMRRIDQNARGILYILDDRERVVGSLTDGDIRRWLLKTNNLNGKINDLVFRDTKYLYEEDRKKSQKCMREWVITSVPIVDREKVLLDIEFRTEKPVTLGSRHALAHQTVIIMAGGKGTRLYPYTKILPKPLIPIGDIPILERIFGQFYLYGAKEFYLTVNYRKEMIRAYFADSNLPYKIHFVDEEKPLGTAGGIRLIRDDFSDTVIVSNCDILIETDYEKILEHHKRMKNAMTIVSSLKNVVIPYGVLYPQEQGRISLIEEKPKHPYFINTGMYFVEPEYLEWIPKNTFYHMTELAEKMIKARCKVGMYPIGEDAFLDMGEFEELKKMEERIGNKASYE